MMDEDEIDSLFQVCKGLKYKFCDVFAADGFFEIITEQIHIVNLYSSGSIGEHVG